ncbi:hypothetical protein ACFSTH_03895 [Paenibacillus yanchengensis]|uniref:PspA/IM30 family protein n=1 Tax=Paenibacillus yanchengensis TaxID=2035833 RepID=A0ABW4YJP2_9BACL
MDEILRMKRVLQAHIHTIINEKKDTKQVMNKIIAALQRQANISQSQLSAQTVNERRLKLSLVECRSELLKYERYKQLATEANDRYKLEQIMTQQKKTEQREKKLQEEYELFRIQYEPLMEWNQLLLTDVEHLQQKAISLQTDITETAIFESLVSMTEGSEVMKRWEQQVLEVQDRLIAEQELRN